MREWIVALALVVGILREAQAHDGYKLWINKAGNGCCNEHDCAPIGDADVDDGVMFTKVRIEGEWCTVQPHHYLKTGNAPDWSTAHVCVQKVHYHTAPSAKCHRLKCFQPKPKF